MKVVHGGNIHKVAREYGFKEDEIIDFSANINPLGVPSSLKEAIINRFNEVENYPDPEYCMLIESIAKYLDIEKEYVIPGNGATELIFLALNALSPQKAMVLAPTFGEYERALRKAKAEIVYHNLKREDDFKVNVKDLLKESKNMDVLVICNPNNPTGQILSKVEVKELLVGCKEQNTFLFLDEAFIDFLEDEDEYSAMDFIYDYKNLFILRAYTKFYGIPGLRLGFGLSANLDLIDKMQEYKEPWSINTFADIGGQVLLKDKKYIEKTKNYITKEADYLFNKLDEIPELKVYKPSVNYIFIRSDREDIDSILIQKGIMIRSCSNYNNLDGSYFRVAVKDRRSNDILIKSLMEAFDEGKL